MIGKLTLYRASCDKCHILHPMVAPKSALKTFLDRDGWKVTGDHVTCPDCRAKMGEENEEL